MGRSFFVFGVGDYCKCAAGGHAATQSRSLKFLLSRERLNTARASAIPNAMQLNDTRERVCTDVHI